MLELTCARPADLDRALAKVSDFLGRHRPQSRPLISLPVLIDRATHGAWVRSWLAQHDPSGTSAGVAVVPAWDALDGLIAVAYASEAPAGARIQWWEGLRRDDPWSAAALTHRILGVWRDHPGAPELKAVHAYTDASASPRADVRRTLLAERAGRLLREAMSHDAAAVLPWASEPSEGSDAWFRFTLRKLGVQDSPAGWRTAPDPERLRPLLDRPVVIVGLADADPATIGLIEAIAEIQDVCWIRPSTALGVADTPPSSVTRAQGVEIARLKTLPAFTPGDPGSSSPCPTLANWRAWMTSGTPPEAPAEEGRVLFPAWTPRREVEQVRDELLRRFNNEDFEPRQVRILTPDLATYGPLILDVFSESGDGRKPLATFADAGSPPKAKGQVPKIPLQLIGLGLTSTNPVAAALLKALDLLTDRLTVSGWFELLCIPQVKRRFGLTHLDNDSLRKLLASSGARWGFNGAERGEVYGIEAPVHSVDFGLQRMALSAFVHQELDPAKGEVPTRWGHANALLFPTDVGGSEGMQASARLQIAFETLRIWHKRLWNGPAAEGSGTWPALLGELLDDLLQTGSSTQFLRQDVNEVLLEVLGEDTSPSATTVASLLRERFDRGLKGDAKGLPGVQVMSLDEANALPAELVILMGLNSGTFPRRDDRPSWMPEGDRPSRTDRDQQAFTAAVLAAKREVWLTWTAREPRRGEEVPPSSLVEDLIDALRLDKDERRNAVQPHGRHRWSVSAGEPWGTSMVAAAEAVSRGAKTEEELSWGDQVVPTADDASGPPPRTISLLELRNALLNPSKTLLTKGLGVWLDNDERDLSDADPRKLASALESWMLKDTLIRLLLEDPDADDATAFEVTVGDGLLPANALGRAQFDAYAEECRELVVQYREWMGSTPEPSCVAATTFDIDGQEITLTGELPEAFIRQTSEGQAMHIFGRASASKADKSKHLLKGWLELLLANAVGRPAPAAFIAYVDKRKPTLIGLCIRPAENGLWHAEQEAISPAVPNGTDEETWLADSRRVSTARDTLEQLVRLALLSERMPLPLFEESSHALAKELVTKGRDPKAASLSPADLLSSAIGKAGDQWFPTYYSKGDCEDPYVSRLHPSYDLVRDLERLMVENVSLRPSTGPDLSCALSLALHVWWPVACARVTSDKFKNHFLAGGNP
ncbi:MAG: hypothetical protein EA397_01265 [Deltaproteobacteria bacterium]|nr:MAG: hypothetical protein EA397_01265 [Deltaproteobacteria bacterium]